MVIADKKIGPGNRPFVIAEIGLNHAEHKLAKNLIDQAISGAVRLNSNHLKLHFGGASRENFEVRRKGFGYRETDYEMLKKMSYPRGRRSAFEYAKAVRLYSALDLEVPMSSLIWV